MINWLHPHYKWAPEFITHSIMDSLQRCVSHQVTSAGTGPAATSLGSNRTPAGAPARRWGQIKRVVIRLNVPHFTASHSFTAKHCSLPGGPSHWQVLFLCVCIPPCSQAHLELIFCSSSAWCDFSVLSNIVDLKFFFPFISFISWWVYGPNGVFSDLFLLCQSSRIRRVSRSLGRTAHNTLHGWAVLANVHKYGQFVSGFGLHIKCEFLHMKCSFYNADGDNYC